MVQPTFTSLPPPPKIYFKGEFRVLWDQNGLKRQSVFFENLGGFVAFQPPRSGPPEAARRLRRFPIGSPPLGEFVLDLDLDVFSTKINDFQGEIRVIPGLTRYQSIILINYLSSGKVRMYYFFIFVIIWYRYQCFIFVFFTVPIIYFDRNLS